MTEPQPSPDLFVHRERWVVQVTLGTDHPPDDRQLEAMADDADRRDMTVAARDSVGEGSGLVFTVDVPADLVGQAPGWAFAVAGRGGMTGAELVDMRVCAPEVYEAEALRPDTPELLAATDVATVLGVSRQRVHQLHSGHADFPAPYARLGSGPIWARSAIEAFDRRWNRRPGRPARAG